MSILVTIIGGLTVVASLLPGLNMMAQEDGKIIGLLCIGAGVAGCIVCLAIASILDKQNLILEKLTKMEERGRIRERNIAPVRCIKCGKEYEGDYNTCPHCGYRQ